jgi:CRISPR system Cascade subunit CasC
MTFLDVHVVQSVPPSCLNRDEAGSPKTAVYGGVRRARVSSQAWKRAVRKVFEADPGFAHQAGIRTRRLPQVIGDRVTAAHPALAETADLIGLAAASAVFKIKQAAPRKPGGRGRPPSGRPVTEYLLFLGEEQVDRVVAALGMVAADLAASGDDFDRLKAVVAPLGLDRLGVTGHPVAVALFGRMVADSPETGVDAACQVAHAISTHRLSENQFDFFTAVDDVAADAGERGTGMIGAIEFSSATLYRYACVDMRSLVINLDGEADRALDAAVAFAKAFALSMPSGRRTTFANNTRPDFVLLNVREDQPVSLVGAFEEPVSEDGGGLIGPSVSALLRYAADQDVAYSSRPAASLAICPAWLGDALDRDQRITTPETAPLNAVLERIRTVLAAQIGHQ